MLHFFYVQYLRFHQLTVNNYMYIRQIWKYDFHSLDGSVLSIIISTDILNLYEGLNA